MPDLTTRYGLKKPVQDGSETADLRVWVGENMDLLDVAIGQVEDKTDAAVQAATTAQQAAGTAQQTADEAKVAAATAQQTANSAQQAASAAQAAADAAQATADTALSTAQAAQNTANAASQAVANHASAAAPHSGHAKLNSENTFSAKNTFAAGVQLGDANTDLIDVMGLVVPLNTHTKQVTAWDSAFPEKPRTIQIKYGSTVLATIEVTERNSEGKVTRLKITQGIRTRTWNIAWTTGKEFPDSVTVSTS